MTSRPPFNDLESAYQLHYYLCFKTHYLREALVGKKEQELVSHAAEVVCNKEGYHLLETKLEPTYVRILLSLKPDQSVSRAVQRLKGNISRQFSATFTTRLPELRMPTLWARGYFARSSGKVNLDTVRSYVDSQIAHHGYRGTWTEALRYRNPQFKSPAFSLAHCVTILQYHLVLVTDFRIPIFDEVIAPKLFQYVIAIGEKRGFKVDRMTVLPDHIHLLIEALPSLAIGDCALSLVNNTRHWMEKNYWGVLKQANAWDVWRPSFYAGTVGEYTTAQVRRFLSES
jgi:putative transposase